MHCDRTANSLCTQMLVEKKKILNYICWNWFGKGNEICHEYGQKSNI